MFRVHEVVQNLTGSNRGIGLRAGGRGGGGGGSEGGCSPPELRKLRDFSGKTLMNSGNDTSENTLQNNGVGVISKTSK